MTSGILLLSCQNYSNVYCASLKKIKGENHPKTVYVGDEAGIFLNMFNRTAPAADERVFHEDLTCFPPRVSFAQCWHSSAASD